MITFLIICALLFMVAVGILALILGIGSVFLTVFGDLIVCIIIIVLIVKLVKMIKKKKE